MLRAGTQATVIGQVTWVCTNCHSEERAKVQLVENLLQCAICGARYTVRCDVVRVHRAGPRVKRIEEVAGQEAEYYPIRDRARDNLREYIKENTARWRQESLREEDPPQR